MSRVTEGLDKINESIVRHVLDYLKTGVFKNKTANAYMIAYSEVHKLADDENDSSKKLFEYYQSTIKRYMQDAQQSMVKERGEKLIELFIRENGQCKILIHWMRKVFTYLDKFYTKNANIGTLCANGLKLYFNELYNPLKKYLFEAVDKMIEADRNCEVVDRSKIKNLLRIFSEVDMKNPELNKRGDELFWTGEFTNTSLNEWFNNEFIKDTEQYVSNKGSSEISRNSAPEYIKSSLKYLCEEESRKAEFISPSFYPKLDQVNFKHLIEINSKTLAKMDTGIRSMFKNEKNDELKLAYELISKHPDSLKSITEEMDPYIRERGDELFNDKELSRDTIKFIPKLISLKIQMDNLVEYSFNNHILFQDTKNKAFSYFMNKEFYAKQLANFCDYEMKIGIKGNSESQIDEKLNNIINVFKCLNNKLAFQLDYAKKLSDRLINSRTQSMIAEKNLITKLKSEAGVAYVNKMTSMMQDLESSRSEMDLFRKSDHRGSPNGVTFSVQVLQNGAWEIEKSKFDKIEIPPFLLKCLEDFNNFYIGRHKNHKLTWAYGLGNIEIQFLKLKKQYKSISTIIQYLILFNLEKYTKITISKLAELIGIKEDIVANEATFLLYHPSFNPKKSKTQGLILSEAGDGADIEINHNVWVNVDFSINSLILNTIPTKTRKKVGEDEEQEQKDIQNLRAYRNIIIDATITRIMKGRINQKTTHAFLVAEVAKQIEMFQAQPPQIKERIEALIEKQIIKRKDGDKSCYEYVA